MLPAARILAARREFGPKRLLTGNYVGTVEEFEDQNISNTYHYYGVGAGGGIAVYAAESGGGNTGSTIIRDSEISYNKSYGSGGGVWISNASSSTTTTGHEVIVTNSTVHRNHAVSGGCIGLDLQYGEQAAPSPERDIQLSHSTISGNMAGIKKNGRDVFNAIGGGGGGVFFKASKANADNSVQTIVDSGITISNSIIADNLHQTPSDTLPTHILPSLPSPDIGGADRVDVTEGPLGPGPDPDDPPAGPFSNVPDVDVTVEYSLIGTQTGPITSDSPHLIFPHDIAGWQVFDLDIVDPHTNSNILDHNDAIFRDEADPTLEPLSENNAAKHLPKVEVDQNGVYTLTPNQKAVRTRAILEASAVHDTGEPDLDPGDDGVTPEFDQRDDPFDRIVDFIGIGDDDDSSPANTLDGIDMGAYEHELCVAPANPDADFDDDGAVDGADFVIWQLNFGRTDVGNMEGDADGDGDVDRCDLAIWEDEFQDNTSIDRRLAKSFSRTFD